MKAFFKKWVRALGLDRLFLQLLQRLLQGLTKKLTGLCDRLIAALSRVTDALKNENGENPETAV